jgi:hypothetical protein
MNSGFVCGDNMHNIINISAPFAETPEAAAENGIKLFTSIDKGRVIAAIEYIQHFEEKNPAHNFKRAEVDNGEQLRSGLPLQTFLNKMKAAHIIRIDEIYDLRAESETQQVIEALQKALHDGKLVILSGDPVSMEKFMQAHAGLKAEAALPAISAETIRKRHETPHRQRSYSASGRSS